MDPKAQLERKIASANDRLRAAQRDGNYAAITKAFQEREELLDQYPPSPSP